MSEKSEPNTSTPVQHPPREAGQTWRTECDGREWTGVLKRRYDDAGRDEGWFTENGDYWSDIRWGSRPWSATLVSPAKPAVDRAGCLAPEWCGIHRILPTPGRDDHFFAYRGPHEVADDHLYCSPVCRDARVPPLAPVLPSGAVDTGTDVRVDKNKPAPVVQAPVCLGCRKSPCNHGYVMCEQGVGGWGRRETMGAVMLHETKLPERLTPARLAHSMQIEDDTLEDA